MSQNPRLKRTDNPVGLMLKRQRQNNRNTRIPKCEAYAWNTDFPQRPGALFHGAFYHSLTSELRIDTIQDVCEDLRLFANLGLSSNSPCFPRYACASGLAWDNPEHTAKFVQVRTLATRSMGLMGHWLNHGLCRHANDELFVSWISSIWLFLQKNFLTAT